MRQPKKVTTLYLALVLLTCVCSIQAQEPGPVAPWMHGDVGAPVAGDAITTGGGVFEITGAGADIWGTADNCHYMFIEMSGDGMMQARVSDNGSGSNAWTKGGVMIRETLEGGSMNVFVAITGGSGEGATFQWRNAPDGASASNRTKPAAVAPPYWVRLVREGNTFSGYLSEDGENWYQEGASQDVVLADPVYVGIAVTSHTAGELRTFTVDNITGEGGAVLADPAVASAPVPASDATDVLRDSDLSWEPGIYAATHNVYLSTRWDDVNDGTALEAEGLSDASFDPGRLAFNATYFWRVDEVNSAPDNTVYTGDIWNFTVEPEALMIADLSVTASSAFVDSEASKTIDGSGLINGAHGTDLTTMWLTDAADVDARWIQYDLGKVYTLQQVHAWNHNSQTEAFLGYGIKEALIETSTDGETWTEFGIVEIPQASGTGSYTGSDVALDEVEAQYVKITVVSNYSALGLTQAGLSEVQFFYIPVQAREPQPADGSEAAGVDVELVWRAGRKVAQHEVVFSEDKQAVIDNSAVVGTTEDTSYDPGSLTLAREYYWKINEVNESETTAVYEGDLWTFTTPSQLVIDDMESYQPEEGLFIWEAWVDGFGDDDNGSVVGNGDDPEYGQVYEGSQSLPMTFDNTAAAMSEATRTFDEALDLTQGNPESLTLQIHGDAPGVVIGNDTATIGASGADLWGTADEGRFVYKNLSGDGSITAKVESLANVQAWAKAGVMIRESDGADSADAYTVTSAASGLTFQYRLETFASATSDSGSRNDFWLNHNDRPVWVRVERLGDEFNGYISVDGTTWEASVSNPQTIVMIQDVKIGLCVTSHDNTVSTVAVFSNISTTGSVSGSWETVEWGGGESGHPNNEPAPMYVRLTDTTGKEKVIDHPDPQATLIAEWDEWIIPLDALSPVNPTKVESITVGVGGSGVAGKVFVDYLRTAKAYQTNDPGTEGLLARYEFEGDALDSSVNGLDGTVTDGEFVDSGMPDMGMALQLNGAGDVDLGNPALLDFATEDWTVSAWYKTGMTGSGDDFKGAIVAKGGDTGGGHRYALIMSESTEGAVTLVCDDDSTKVLAHSTTLTNDDEWHHVAGQRKATAINIYIDGVVEATSSVTAEYDLSGTAQHNAYIGAVTNNGDGSLYKIYHGLVDDVRIYHRALSEGEVIFLSGQ